MFLQLRPLTAAILLCIASTPMALGVETIEGFTEPYRTVDVSIGEPGVVTEINVQAGTTVTAGDALLSLDTSVLEATLAVAKQRANVSGSVEAARAELTFRNDRLQQIVELRKREHATQRELQRAEADVAIAQARLKLAKEEQKLNQLDCKRIEAQIARRHVSSPYSGIIAEVHREIGESLLVTDPRVMTLVQLDRLRTRFSATPRQAGTLRANQKVKIIISDEKGEAQGTIERIAPIVDAKSGTLEVHVVIDNAKQQWRSGTRCLMEVQGSSGVTESFAGNTPRRPAK